VTGQPAASPPVERRGHAAPSDAAPPREATAGAGVRVAIIATRFNGSVVDLLVEGARDCLLQHGVAESDLTLVWVPGAFELPLAAQRVAGGGRVDAVVCLGAVIRGETAHFEFIAGEAARGIQDVALRTGVPVSFGVLTTESVEQAMDRAGGLEGNKGYESALAALEMVGVLRSLGKGKP
jgi:6,7-dimethyl-8-ribityllumazine synthase